MAWSPCGPASTVAAWPGPSGGRGPAASLLAFLEGSEDTGARPRPGSLAARGAARGLLRAGQCYLAWPSARLRPGLWGGVGVGGSAPTRGPAPVCLCWTCEPSEPSARPASAVRGLRALRPGRGLAGPGVTGHVALAPRPQPPAPQPSVTRGWGVGCGQASCLGVPWGVAPSCPRVGISSRPLPFPLDLFLPKALVIPASWLACPHGCPPADGVRVPPPHPRIP